VGRDYEWELMPLGIDQRVAALVWSPLGWGRLTGKIRRGQPLPKSSRLHASAQWGPPVDDERLYRVVDTLEEIGREMGKTVPQVAIAWLLTRPTISSVIIGARNEAQLRDNLGAVGWSMSREQLAKLDKASEVMPSYPYYPYRTQEGFARLNPPPV
jgi:aryl-alcohol dehydrogenase-like predicted oxidoreductase